MKNVYASEDLVVSKELLQSIGISAEKMRIETSVLRLRLARVSFDDAWKLSKLDLAAFQNELKKRSVAYDESK